MSRLDELVGEALARHREQMLHGRERFVEDVRALVGEEVYSLLAPTLDPQALILRFSYGGHPYVVYAVQGSIRAAHQDFSEWEPLTNADSLLVYLGTRHLTHRQ